MRVTCAPALLACAALERRLAVAARYLDPAWLALLRLRDPHLEHAVLEPRRDGVGVDAVRQGERAVETAERALDAVPPALLRLVLGLALARDREVAVLDLDVHVALGQARQVRLQHEAVLGLDQVDRWNPPATLLAIGAEEGIEEPVHVTREGLGLHQKGHVAYLQSDR